MLAAMSDDPIVVRAGRLVDVESGEVLSDRAVVVRGDRIESVVAADAAPAGVAATVPWALEVLEYLDHRRSGGAAIDCPMPELFAAIRRRTCFLPPRLGSRSRS